eukprot:10729760-Prorocentrum_lima.AAC.1
MCYLPPSPCPQRGHASSFVPVGKCVRAKAGPVALTLSPQHWRQIASDSSCVTALIQMLVISGEPHR